MQKKKKEPQKKQIRVWWSPAEVCWSPRAKHLAHLCHPHRQHAEHQRHTCGRSQASFNETRPAKINKININNKGPLN